VLQPGKAKPDGIPRQCGRGQGVQAFQPGPQAALGLLDDQVGRGGDVLALAVMDVRACLKT
jgi:hypothetical protein